MQKEYCILEEIHLSCIRIRLYPDTERTLESWLLTEELTKLP